MNKQLFIRPVLSDESQSAIFNRDSVCNILNRNGIFFTGDDSRDIDLIHHSRLNTIPKFEKPVIILERIDSAVILSRREISDPNVIGIIKNTILNPPELNNTIYTYGRYHATLIAGYLGEKSPVHPNHIYSEPLIAQNYFEKLECGFTYGSYDHLRNLFDTAARPEESELRQIDISFAGTVNYGAAEIINLHRLQAVHAIKKINNRVTDIVAGRSRNFREYLKTLSQSKICVSPWGLGEACYRDFEAILSGCVLVKPDSSFVLSYPDIYQNNITYVPCKADFSDLHEVCNIVLMNWPEYLQMRRHAFDLIKETCTDTAVAERLSSIFRNAYDRFIKFNGG